MSDSEEENYCFFGKPLEPYDEDSFPKKRPIALEEQVATDAQGRRRFHGAFTGGFSAGFFNTVGSLEGWTPKEFRSTRQEKADNKRQKPEDFMDDEDLGEFGIAPQTVKATKDYATTNNKRKRQVYSDGPIPGEPVLHSILTSGNETIGYLLLRNMGGKARKQEQTAPQNDNKVYGCEMPRVYEVSRNDEDQYKMPEIYKEFFATPKSNTFGLGYTGLDKSHVNLFQSSNLVIKERDKKKLSIRGQAFGVGAFEEDDEDIYVKEDMTRYDFELTAENSGKKPLQNKTEHLIFDNFVKAKSNLDFKEFYSPPTIPQSFTGKHKVKKSRFEPLLSETEELSKRKDMNADVRRSIYNESIEVPESTQPAVVDNTPILKTIKEEPKEPNSNNQDKTAKWKENLMFDKFVSSSQPEDPSNILEVVKPMETTHGTDEMKAAVKMKMFGPLTRVIFDWQPHTLLCRRFNVPEPNSDGINLGRNRKKVKNLIFEIPKQEEAPWILKPGLNTSNSEEVPTESTDGSAVTSQSDQNTEKTDKVEENSNESNDDINRPKDITEKINIEQNLDLFKAVFLSSDEESEPEEAQTDDKEDDTHDNTDEIKTNLLSDDLLPKIKPINNRILSGVDFSIFNKPLVANNEEKAPEIVNRKEELDPNLYGPNLPEKSSSNNQNESQNLTSSERNGPSDDEWVEKGDSEHKSKGHKKKHKKHSHKKHKKKKR